MRHVAEGRNYVLKVIKLRGMSVKEREVRAQNASCGLAGKLMGSGAAQPRAAQLRARPSATARSPYPLFAMLPDLSHRPVLLRSR